MPKFLQRSIHGPCYFLRCTLFGWRWMKIWYDLNHRNQVQTQPLLPISHPVRVGQCLHPFGMHPTLWDARTDRDEFAHKVVGTHARMIVFNCWALFAFIRRCWTLLNAWEGLGCIQFPLGCIWYFGIHIQLFTRKEFTDAGAHRIIGFNHGVCLHFQS